MNHIPSIQSFLARSDLLIKDVTHLSNLFTNVRFFTPELEESQFENLAENIRLFMRFFEVGLQKDGGFHSLIDFNSVLALRDCLHYFISVLSNPVHLRLEWHPLIDPQHQILEELILAVQSGQGFPRITCFSESEFPDPP